jgi:hypothetical protein
MSYGWHVGEPHRLWHLSEGAVSMGTVSALAKPKGDDPARAALAASITTVTQARAELADRQRQLEHVTGLVEESRRRVEERRASLVKALESDAEHLATSGHLPAAPAVPVARAAERDAVDAYETAQKAKSVSSDAVAEAEAAIRKAEKGVDWAIANLLAPHAQRLLEQAQEAQRAFWAAWAPLDVLQVPLLHDSVHDTILKAATPGAIEDERRQAATAGIEQTWTAYIAALRSDPNAEPPS